jgi:hypothetical protein
MRTKAALPQKVEFSIARPDNCISVEQQDERVVIRATRDNFSQREKSFFIRYLAAEGYIPAAYQWFAESDLEWSSCLSWIVDSAGLRANHSPKKALRQILWLVACVALGWLFLMIFAIAHAPSGIRARL